MAAAKKAAKRPAKTASPRARPAAPAPTWVEEPAPAQQWSQAPAWNAAPPQPGGMDDRSYGLLLHLSGLSVLLGILGFIGPLVMWLVKKDQSPFVDRHGRAALDFQVSLLIYAVAAFLVIGAITIATLGIGLLLMLPLIVILAIAWFIVAILFPILAGVKANQGLEYDYPLSLRMFRRARQ